MVFNSKTVLLDKWLLLIFFSLFWVASKVDKTKIQNRKKKIFIGIRFISKYKFVAFVVNCALSYCYCLLLLKWKIFHFGGKLSVVFFCFIWKHTAATDFNYSTPTIDRNVNEMKSSILKLITNQQPTTHAMIESENENV